jgi:hypothetical protein
MAFCIPVPFEVAKEDNSRARPQWLVLALFGSFISRTGWQGLFHIPSENGFSHSWESRFSAD